MATSTAPIASSETTLPRPEPPRFHSGKAFFWGIVLILAAGLLAWLVIGHYADNFQDLDQQRIKERQDILQKRNAEDAKWLNDPPSYVDKAKRQIRVPIAEAMKITIPALQANKPHAAYPLTDSPPQPAAAPTSPDKGAGSPKDGNINPPASNPTLNPSASPAPSPVPPGTTATPGATPAVGTAATSTPTPPPAANNNALNPGNPPPPGAQPQPSPAAPGNTETNGLGSPTPSGAQPQPLTNPTPPPTPPTASSENTPSPNPREPGATPGGTP